VRFVRLSELEIRLLCAFPRKLPTLNLEIPTSETTNGTHHYTTPLKSFPFASRVNSHSQLYLLVRPTGLPPTQSVGTVLLPALARRGSVLIPGHHGICRHTLPLVPAAQSGLRPPAADPIAAQRRRTLAPPTGVYAQGELGGAGVLAQSNFFCSVTQPTSAGGRLGSPGLDWPCKEPASSSEAVRIRCLPQGHLDT